MKLIFFFYPISDTTFLSLNHKNRKLKEIFMNESNELIIKNEILCPLNLINFCPFSIESSFSNNNIFLCGLFICKNQTYFLKDENLDELSLSEKSLSSYSSTKRLFLSYFENKYIETIKSIEGLVDPEKNKEKKKEVLDIFLPFIILTEAGESTLNFAKIKNKILNELNIQLNIFDQNIKTELINKKNNSEIFIVSIIKNSLIHFVKINNNIIKEKKENFNFGNYVKNIGILNLGDYLSFIYYDKKAIIINVMDSFENNINPIDTFLFPFEIIYACYFNEQIILVTNNNAFLFDCNSKNIEKKMELNIDISLKYNEININQVQDNIYILINGLNYFLFDINKFEIISDIGEYNLHINTFLIYNRLPDTFEIIKKDLRSDINIQIFREELHRDKEKIKYLKDGRLFVSSYPNKFFIFENN